MRIAFVMKIIPSSFSKNNFANPKANKTKRCLVQIFKSQSTGFLRQEFNHQSVQTACHNMAPKQDQSKGAQDERYKYIENQIRISLRLNDKDLAKLQEAPEYRFVILQQNLFFQNCAECIL